MWHSEKMLLMRLFIAVFVLILTLQSFPKADNIRDFEIEGMSIGDSLLNYMSLDEINSSILKSRYKNNSFVRAEFYNNLEVYDAIQLHFKNDDTKYIIHMLAGAKFFIEDIDNCLKEKKNIEKEFNNIFKNSKFEDWGVSPHPNDQSNKSLVYTSMFFLELSGNIAVQCYDWTNKMGYNDHLKIKLMTDDYTYWIQNEAY